LFLSQLTFPIILNSMATAKSLDLKKVNQTTLFSATMAMSVNSPIMNEDLFGCLLENNATDMETALQHVGLNDNNLDYGIDDHSSNAASDNSSNSESLLPVAYPCNAVSCINGMCRTKNSSKWFFLIMSYSFVPTNLFHCNGVLLQTPQTFTFFLMEFSYNLCHLILNRNNSPNIHYKHLTIDCLASFRRAREP